MKHWIEEDQSYDFEDWSFDDVDITNQYDRESIAELRSNDGISVEEEAFMLGLLDDEEA